MSCQMVDSIDLDDFLADRQDPRFAEFRAHYPTCSECSARVGAWSRTRLALADLIPAESWHPDDEQLAGYCDGKLPHEASQRVAGHLVGCSPCRMTAAAIGRFAPGPVVLDAPQEEPAASIAAWFGWLRRPPAWLGASLAAAAAVVVVLLLRPVPSDRDGEPAQTFADRSPTPTTTPTTAPITSPMAGVEPDFDPPARDFAARSPGSDTRDPAAAIESRPDTSPDGIGPAHDEPAEQPERIAALPSNEQTESDAPEADDEIVFGEPILLASNVPVMRPTYVPGASGLGTSDLGLQQVDFRAESDLPVLTVLAPRHAAATSTASPTLYWHLEAESLAPAEIVLTAEDDIDPLIELWIDPPIAAGLHALSLTELGVTLAPDTPYQWYVSLVPDPDRRSRDVSSGGELLLVPPRGEAARRIADAPAGYLAHRLAETGYWPDAFDTLTRWRAREPDAEVLRAHQAALLRQIGLGAVAASVSD